MSKTFSVMTIYLIIIEYKFTFIVASSNYPCAFIDTINITDNYYPELETTITTLSMEKFPNNTISNNGTNIHQFFENNSYSTYDWTLIPSEFISVYDFVIQNGIRTPTVKHLRACICKIKPCIRFCCPSGQYYDLINRTCQSMATKKSSTHILEQTNITVLMKNGYTRSIITKRNFFIYIGLPCDNMHYYGSNKQKQKQQQQHQRRFLTWTLHENGTIAFKNYQFPNHYCLNAVLREVQTLKHSANKMEWHWQPLICLSGKLSFTLGVKDWTYIICLILTIICMIIILCVYILCTELRNTFFGIAIMAYTLCIIIGYSLLTHLTLTNPNNMSKSACLNIPAFILLHLILSFYILTLIGCHFYLSFYGIILSKSMFWFIFLPMVILVACWSFFVSYGHYNDKSIFGNEICWFDPRNYTIVMYFYVPISLACIFNGIFYILSLVKLSEGVTLANGSHNKSLSSISRNRFKTFWKFFGYTLSTWLVCLASFTINYYRQERSHINYVVAVFMAFHGFGSLYTLVGKNQQIQNFLRRVDDDEDSDDIADMSLPMAIF